MYGNTPAHEALLNHIMTGRCCNGMAGRYCAEGRRLWIEDRADFIASLPSRLERAAWMRQEEENNPVYAAQIRQRVLEIYEKNYQRAA